MQEKKIVKDAVNNIHHRHFKQKIHIEKKDTREK